MTAGREAILYDIDPSGTSILMWKADRRHMATPDVGTRVLYLGTIPPQKPGDEPEARVKILEGEEKGTLGFVPEANVRPLGPIQGSGSP